MSRSRAGFWFALLAAACGGGRDADPPGVTLLTPEGAHQTASQFSPGGDRVSYWTPGSEGWDLMIAGADLSNVRKLASSRNLAGWALWSPDGSRLAFTSTAAGVADIWVVGSDGSGLRQLTRSPGFEFPIMWHPSGDRIAMASSGGGGFQTRTVWVADGRITPMVEEKRPAIGFWSPDGTRIAYVVYDRGQSMLYVADSAGRNARQLTTEGFEDFECCNPPWSPDGSAVVFTSRRTGTGDVWIAPVDGSPARQLTHDVREDHRGVFSPDGQWVAFRSNRGRQTDVWVVPAGGGAEIRVSDDDLEEEWMQWVGRASTIAFNSNRSDEGVWSLSLADGTERRITDDSLRVFNFDVSADGKSLVYTVSRGGGVSDLNATTVVPGPVRALVTGTSENTEPYWSPDGTSVLFQSNRSGNWDVWLVDSAGGAPRQFTDWPTREVDAEWGGDGTIYFLSDREAAPFSDLWKIPPGATEPVRMTTVGTVNSQEPARATQDVFIDVVGGREGQVILRRVDSAGKITSVWDRSNVLSYGHRAFTPRGDSMAVGVEMPAGKRAGFLLPITGGAGRMLLPESERIGPISPDGASMALLLGAGNAGDLGLMSLRDLSIRRLTDTPQNEGPPQFAEGGKSLVFRRSVQRERIGTADLTPLLKGTTP